MNIETIMALIGKWGGLLKFFPSDTDARIGIAEAIGEMAGDEEKIRWLVKRVSQLHREWPGILEVRAILCSKFRPADGIEVYSETFPDGIPSEKEALPQLAAPETKRIAAGEVSGAASIRDTVEDLKRATDMRRVLGPTPIIRPIPVTRVPSGTITQAMVDAAEREYRDKKARESIGISA